MKLIQNQPQPSIQPCTTHLLRLHTRSPTRRSAASASARFRVGGYYRLDALQELERAVHAEGRSRERTVAHGTVYVIGAVDDPNYLSPMVAEQARDLASRLIDQERDEDTYWRGTKLMSLFCLHLPDDVPGRLYVVWGDLTDIWELHLERRAESVELMREAAREFLALNNTTSDLDAYLTRWQELLGQS